MDFLNTFLAFNVAATALTLVAFFAMREPIAAYATAAKEKFASFNVAGATGAATSFVLMATVANLFI
jgi:CDP-diacylglycerol pyrophosphatase